MYEMISLLHSLLMESISGLDLQVPKGCKEGSELTGNIMDAPGGSTSGFAPVYAPAAVASPDWERGLWE